MYAHYWFDSFRTTHAIIRDGGGAAFFLVIFIPERAAMSLTTEKPRHSEVRRQYFSRCPYVVFLHVNVKKHRPWAKNGYEPSPVDKNRIIIYVVPTLVNRQAASNFTLYTKIRRERFRFFFLQT